MWCRACIPWAANSVLHASCHGDHGKRGCAGHCYILACRKCQHLPGTARRLLTQELLSTNPSAVNFSHNHTTLHGAACLLTFQVLSRNLDSSVSVPVYSSQAAAVTSGTAAGENFLSGGDRCAWGRRGTSMHHAWRTAMCVFPVHGSLGSYSVDSTRVMRAHESPRAQGSSLMPCSCRCVLWLGAPPEDKLPKDAAGASSMHTH